MFRNMADTCSTSVKCLEQVAFGQAAVTFVWGHWKGQNFSGSSTEHRTSSRGPFQGTADIQIFMW